MTWPNPLFMPVVVWDENGRPAWRHCCTDGEIHHDQLPIAADRWQIVEPGKSISPSLNCAACGTHGWWTNGQWWWSGVPRDVADALAERRADSDFRERIERRVRADRHILDRLKDGDR